MSCSVVRKGSLRSSYMELELRCGAWPDAESVGYIDVSKKGEWLNVNGIFVDEPYRRKGYGTKLYEAAAEVACENDLNLASTYREDEAHSHDFWRKQARKGRAEVIRGAGHKGQDVYVLNSSCGVDLSGLPERQALPWVAGALAVLLLLKVG